MKSTALQGGTAVEKESDVALSLWLALLKAHSLVLRRIRGHVGEGLTLPQFDVLAQLHRRPAGMTPGELTKELLVTAGNVTGIVDRLVERGLVERRAVPGDRRTRLLVLTPSGQGLVERAIPRHRDEVAGLVSGVPASEQRQLRSLLRSLVSSLEARG
jgi:DNA-binding MarR family transcriptional regulator